MTATATTLTTTHRIPPGFDRLRGITAVLSIVAMSMALSLAVAMSMIGAAQRSGTELPAPGPMPQPMTAPTVEQAPSFTMPETAPAGLDL
jgi:hypothetical protein